MKETSGQAIAEFSLVILLLVLVLFSVLEMGLILNDKMALMSTAREVARICAVEGGKTPNALNRLRALLAADGIDPDAVSASIRPTQAIYGTTIYVDLSYDYPVKSPVVRPLSGPFIPVSAHAVTRSEFVPR
ncbi:MAG: TadE/TadG family type IV pilus assembly protein [Bacillota bacterium]